MYIYIYKYMWLCKCQVKHVVAPPSKAVSKVTKAVTQAQTEAQSVRSRGSTRHTSFRCINMYTYLCVCVYI